MASQLGPDATTFTLKSGHCPFLSVPDEMVEVVEKVAEVVKSRRIA
jgi:uncharacterized protein YlzI (FlbEa/FlbD family)